MLTAQTRGLEVERWALHRERERWRLAQERLDEFQVWCRDVAANVGDLSYQQTRLALTAFGVEVEGMEGGPHPAARDQGRRSIPYKLRITSLQIARSVSKTPAPLTAVASKRGAPMVLRCWSRTDAGSESGRSILLYCMTSG